MWYRKVISQYGGGVDFSQTASEESEAGIDIVDNVDSQPMGLYDELAGILEKMDKSIHDYYNMNHEQQKRFGIY